MLGVACKTSIFSTGLLCWDALAKYPCIPTILEFSILHSLIPGKVFRSFRHKCPYLRFLVEHNFIILLKQDHNSSLVVLSACLLQDVSAEGLCFQSLLQLCQFYVTLVIFYNSVLRNGHKLLSTAVED